MLKVKEWLEKRKRKRTYEIKIQDLMSSTSIKEYFENLQKQITQNPRVDPLTGNIDLKYNPEFKGDEDFYL